jgi:chorismate mutase/prephenate dehydratase
LEIPVNEVSKDSLELLRRQIDSIDCDILKLLNQRAQIVLEIGHQKRSEQGSVFYVPRREREILERLGKDSEGPFPLHGVTAVFREIISACRSLETPLEIAYMGPPATYHHAAAIQKFGNSSNFRPYEHISEVFRAVEKGECHYGVVAIENSTEGVIASTLDNFQRSDLRIYAETFLDIHHQFLSLGNPKDIQKIFSHGQVFGQCREWLERHFPSAQYVEVSSTSRGAELAFAEPGTAAIASQLASEMYGVPILFQNIEDRTQNTTRFVVIGYDSEPPTGRDKTSLIIHLRNRAGALAAALEPFNSNKINLTHLEARPTKAERWEYLFFIEFEGHKEESHVQATLVALEEPCLRIKVLGSYPEENRMAPIPVPMEPQIP